MNENISYQHPMNVTAGIKLDGNFADMTYLFS